jgi:hypothetical protein
LFRAGFVKEEGAFGEGAFVSGTESWFLASRANNFLHATIVFVRQLFYEDQVMSLLLKIKFVEFNIFSAWFMLVEVAFQAFVGGTSP